MLLLLLPLLLLLLLLISHYVTIELRSLTNQQKARAKGFLPSSLQMSKM
jgi:hypothetical protein